MKLGVYALHCGLRLPIALGRVGIYTYMIVHKRGSQMVNKSLLGLAVVVLAAVFGIGVFVGMFVGGGGIAGSPDASPAGSATPTANGGSDAPGATATPAAAATATPAQPASGTPTPERTPIPRSAFSSTNITSYVIQYLNDARTDDGVGTLTTDGRTAESVEEMAQSHSDAMATATSLSHTIEGVTSEDRYDNYDLTSTCSFATTETPSDNELEAIGQTVAGQTYTENGTEQFNEEDADVARALVDQMLADEDYAARLLHPDAGRMGVGVSLTSNGDV